MGNTKGLEVQSPTTPIAKGSVQWIDVADSEWLDYKRMFTIVGWKRDIPDKCEELMKTDIETYEVVVYLNKQKEANAGVVAGNENEMRPLKLSDIESKDDLIAECKKDPAFWSKKRRFIETQLELIEEEIPQAQEGGDGGCCNVM